MATTIACPGCAAREGWDPVEVVQSFTLHRCRSCQLIFADPMSNPGESWYDRAYRIRHFAVDDRVRDYYRWTLAHLSNNERILDVGCGEGVFVSYARQCGFEAFGIDFSANAVRVGREQLGNDSIFVGGLEDLERLNLPQQYDLITFYEVLEHLGNPREFIELVQRHLKPNGCIALSVPNRNRWPMTEFNDYPPHHLTRWDEQAMRQFLRSMNLTVVDMRIGSRLRSVNIFLGYLLRCALYRMTGMYAKGLDVPKVAAGETTRGGARHERLRNVISALKPRQVRDALMWVPTLVLAPALIWFFRGYNLMVIARKRED